MAEKEALMRTLVRNQNKSLASGTIFNDRREPVG